MGNDARNARKTAEDESSSSKKKPSGGKADSSATTNGETSGTRRSTRSQTHSSSSSSVRKSQRLGKRGLELETTSPLRRSVRENKYQSPSSVNKGGSGLKAAPGGSRKEKTVEELSPKVGETTKKRLHPRQFKAMFQLQDSSALGSESKKKNLENSYSNSFSSFGDPSDGISVNCGEGVDSDPMKSEEGLQLKGDEHGHISLGNTNKWLNKNCNEGKDGNSEDQECSDGMGTEEDCAVKNGSGVEEPCEREDAEEQLVSGGQIPLSLSSTLEIPAGKNSVNNVVGEEDGGVVEKPSNHDTPTGLSHPSDDVTNSVCNQKPLIIGSSDVEFIPSGSPLLEMGSLTEDLSKCSENPRLDHTSSTHEHCRLSNSDRGECSDAAEEEAWRTSGSNPIFDADQDVCVKCKRNGNLMHCCGKACRRSYHPSCLWTNEKNAHFPNWYCSECINKKLTLGVHSASEGIESILDVREAGLSNSDGSTGEKQYFVKYKGLAHIHNCWIPETQLLHEAPESLVNFSGEDKLWKPEWAVPHRLLVRRSIVVNKPDVHVTSKSYHVWLVKWHGLEYDQATWELEDTELFKKPEFQQLLKEYEARRSGGRGAFQQLLKEYEIRHNDARNSNMPQDNKIQEKKKNLHGKHGRGSDSLRMESVNKLREFNQKRHNVLLLEEEDRVMKVIYFISSILSSVYRPFLIIAPRQSLAFWEAEFLRFTSFINVVVYGGNIDSRKIIRSLEFYQEGGELMLQVLLSSVEDICEDLEEIKGMEWEAVIVDDCQKNSFLGDLGCIKTLVTDWKLLLFNAQLKDTITEYANILSLLEPVGSSNQSQGIIDASNKDLNVLKERVCSFIISPRFQEYWVPVVLSNVQLEQYCSFLLSNSSVILSSSKSDPIGSLNDILVSTQKCCDHPYLVNPGLRMVLLPEQPSQDAALNMGVKASGKLLLLDELLSEFRNQGLKVLIIFQPISGSGKDNLEIILDDFLTWRFGEDSYEHIAGGGQPSTKKAALNKFNKEQNRSFLLLETRACLPSIKLSLVDSVIILNSDWNPLNDLRALQKIIIDSKFKPINVFRFYCSCTVEEKALVIAKNDIIPENTQQISPSTKRMLLMWGSSYLFSRLDEFHRDKGHPRDNVAFGLSFVTDVCQEIVSLTLNHGKPSPCRYISLARQDGGCYFTNIPLLGEQRTQLEEGVSSHSFWGKLLEGKKPNWNYVKESYERVRKRGHYSNELSSSWNVQSEEPAKKRKESSPRQAKENPAITKDKNKEFHGHPDISAVQKDDRNCLHDQRGLLDILKPIVLALCEALMLKDEVKKLAERFLEFVLNNHQITKEPETLVQAFLISVCWTAAEILENKIDHKESLEIARDKMKFTCLGQETDSVYLRMKMLMKIFLARKIKTPNPSIDPVPVAQDNAVALNDNCVTTITGSADKIGTGIDESSFSTNDLEEEVHLLLQSNNEKDSLGNVDKLIKKCEKKMELLKEKQNNELVDFDNKWEKKRLELEDTYKLELAVIRYSHVNSTARADKLKTLDNDFANKRKYLEGQVSNLRKELEAKQQEERDGDQRKIAQLLTLLKSMAPVELLLKPQSADSLELLTGADIRPCKDSNEALSVADYPPAEHHLGETPATHTRDMLPCSVENNLSRDEVLHLSEKQGAACEHLVTVPSSENLLGLQGVGAGNSVGDPPAEDIPSCRQECVADENCGTGEEMTNGDVQMDDVIVDRQASPERDGGNDASTSFYCLSTEQLQCPEYPLTEQRIADEIANQGFGDELFQQRVEDRCNTVPGDETSLPDPANAVSFNLPVDEGASVVPVPVLSFPVSVGNDQVTIASSSQLNSQPNNVPAAVQNSCVQIQLDIPQQVAASTIDANIRQDVQHVSVSEGRVASIAHSSHPNPAAVVNPNVPHVSSSYHSDPLQIEYDKIRKEIGVISNTHEEMKLRLRCECDKEIEETVSQIRKKYDVKFDEVESSFSLTKKELESYLNMVMMNKFLADALRSKCMDYKAAAQGGIQKGVPSDMLQQPQPTSRASSSGGSSAVPTTITPNVTQPPPVRSVNPFPMLSPRSTLTRSESRASSPHLQHISAPSAMSAQPTPHGQSRQRVHISHGAEELLMDIARQNDAVLRRLEPDNLQNHESWDLSQFGRAAEVQDNQQPQPATADVVCLSDDD